MAYDEVEVPVGDYIGWGNRKGQVVEGKVLDYGEFDGLDYGKKPCPLVEIELTYKAASFNKKGERTDYKPGDVVQVTCGLKSLKRAIKHAEPKRGNGIKILLDDFLDVTEGTAKLFKVYIDRSTSAGSAGGDNGSAVDDDDEPGF